MADDYLTLADLTVINSNDTVDIDVTTLFQYAPLVASLYATQASNGSVHKWFRTTGAPVVGFRSVNDGREHDSTVRVSVTSDCKLLDASFTVDTAIAGIYKGGPQALLTMEAMEHLKQAFFKLEQQVLLSTTSGDAAGFQGLQDSHTAPGTFTISSGGTTALSSVYLIRSALNGVALAAGNDGSIEVGESLIQRVPGATGHFMAWVTQIQAWYTLQIASTTDTVRLCNIDASANGVDDDLIFSGLAAFPVSQQPNIIVMNRRSLEQLRSSRTATNGTGSPAPRPTEVAGIPIVVTDALTNAETQVV